MSPEITAVITTHDRPDEVHHALASVQAEAHKDLEIVVVDDGGTFEAPRDTRVPIRVIHGSHLGVARARNLGLEAARGEFTIYLDDDDVALPNRISRLLAAARQHDAAMCFGMTRRVVDGRTELLPDVPTNHVSSGLVGFCDLLTCTPHVNAVLVRTETLRAAGGFDAGAEHFDDWSAWLRIADSGATIWSVADAVADWRIHWLGLSGILLRSGAMKRRLRILFEILEGCLSEPNARALGAAQQIVASGEIATYDDYVRTMAMERDRLHAAGTCFGRPLHLPAHKSARRPHL